MTCYIICAGSHKPEPVEKRPGDLVIAADAGFSFAAGYGLSPDLCVGDFDSLGRVPEGVGIVRHPPEKDDTDAMLAVREGVARGYSDFVFYGALGGARIDHTLANLELLSWLASTGAKAVMKLGDTRVTAVGNGSLIFPEGARGYVSVFASGGRAEGVTETGLKYSLTDAAVDPLDPFPQCVSNEFTGRQAVITVRKGVLTVVWFDPAHEPRIIHGHQPQGF